MVTWLCGVTDVYDGGAERKGTIYRSTDDGANWAAVFTVPDATDISSIATDGAGVWCAGTNYNEIWRSIDDGLNWTMVWSDFPGSAYIPSIATDKAGVWCAANNGGWILRSTDNGASWSTDFSTRYAYCIATDELGNWYAGCMNSGSAKVYRSIDNGANWVLTYDPGVPGARCFDITTDKSGVWCVTTLAISPSGLVGIYRFVDGDANMTLVEDTVTGAWADGLSTNEAGVWCAGVEGLIYRSIDNGLTWVSVYDTSDTLVISVCAGTGGVWCAGTTNDTVTPADGAIFRSTDSGANWTRIYNDAQMDYVFGMCSEGIGGTLCPLPAVYYNPGSVVFV
jgi:photosystem II stability/assembly factor-like uncharacterized protein